MEHNVKIDYRESKDDSTFITRIDKEIDIAIDRMNENEEETTIYISNITSAHFCELYDIEPEDFNGWQCDWWSNFSRRGEDVHVFGCAWHGTVELSIRL
jgi:hypothetical protein